MSDDDNEEIDIYIPTDEEYWQMLPDAEGIDKADILLQLSMSYHPERDGQFAITLAEVALDIYREIGYQDGETADFAFAFATIAENKAKIGDYLGAIEMAEKAIPLIDHQELGAFEELRWDLIKWFIKIGRLDKAILQLAENYLKQQ